MALWRPGQPWYSYPAAEVDLCTETPREKWKRSYRAQRLASRNAEAKRMAPKIFRGEIGTIYSVRIEDSRSVGTGL